MTTTQDREKKQRYRDKQQKRLDKVYAVRDFFLGWYFQKITQSDLRQGFWGRTPFRLWLFWQLALRYQYDAVGKDYPRTFFQTWNHNGGDCEDAAVFFQYVLRSKGYRTRLFRISWKQSSESGTSSHTVVIYRDPKKMKFGILGSGPLDFRRATFHVSRKSSEDFTAGDLGAVSRELAKSVGGENVDLAKSTFGRYEDDLLQSATFSVKWVKSDLEAVARYFRGRTSSA